MIYSTKGQSQLYASIRTAFGKSFNIDIAVSECAGSHASHTTSVCVYFLFLFDAYTSYTVPTVLVERENRNYTLCNEHCCVRLMRATKYIGWVQLSLALSLSLSLSHWRNTHKHTEIITHTQYRLNPLMWFSYIQGVPVYVSCFDDNIVTINLNCVLGYGFWAENNSLPAIKSIDIMK